MTRPKYRAYVWKSRGQSRDQDWLAGVWEEGGPAVLPPDSLVGFPTHPEAVAAGLDWANELNAHKRCHEQGEAP